MKSYRIKRFKSTFIIKTAKKWNTLQASVFPDKNNQGFFKPKVNRYSLVELAIYLRPHRQYRSGEMVIKRLAILNEKDFQNSFEISLSPFFELKSYTFISALCENTNYTGCVQWLMFSILYTNGAYLLALLYLYFVAWVLYLLFPIQLHWYIFYLIFTYSRFVFLSPLDWRLVLRNIGWKREDPSLYLIDMAQNPFHKTFLIRSSMLLVADNLTYL